MLCAVLRGWFVGSSVFVFLYYSSHQMQPTKTQISESQDEATEMKFDPARRVCSAYAKEWARAELWLIELSVRWCGVTVRLMSDSLSLCLPPSDIFICHREAPIHRYRRWKFRSDKTSLPT